MIWHIIYAGILLFLLYTVNVTGKVNLTVIPSQNVEANEEIIMKCDIDPDEGYPVIATFSRDKNTLCSIEYKNGSCKPDCNSNLTAYCLNERSYSMHVPAPFSWNGDALSCESFFSQSIGIILSVTVKVTAVTLTPTSITVINGQQKNLICTTSFCFPKANISWFMSSRDVTSQSTFTTDELSGQVRTNSSLLRTFFKSDDGIQVYCEARNKPNQSVNSATYEVSVLYKPELASNTSGKYTVKEGTEAVLVCILVDANPKTGIIWKWYRTDDPKTELYNGSTLTIQNIQRQNHGSYNCTAKNSAGTSDAIGIEIDVQYRPDLASDTANPYKINEGRTAILQCRKTAANPDTILTWKWFNTASPSHVLYHGPNFTMFNIQRNKSGSYNCTATNSVGTSEALILCSITLN